MMKENLDLSEQQIETIAFNIYKDIKPYIQENTFKFVIWLSDKYVSSVNEMIKIDNNYKYDICKYDKQECVKIKITHNKSYYDFEFTKDRKEI